MHEDLHLDSDVTQLIRLREGNESVMNDLFTRYHRSLLYFAKSILQSQEVAEEIVSDSFVKLWKARASFQTMDNVKAFLYIATKNASLNHLKAASSRIHFEYEYSNLLVNSDPDSYAKIIRAELLQVIYDEVAKLPEKPREVFKLTFFEDLTTEEICDRLGMTAAAVFTNRSRAIEFLRKVFKNKELLFLFSIFVMNHVRNLHDVELLVLFFNKG